MRSLDGALSFPRRMPVARSTSSNLPNEVPSSSSALFQV
jgi:hypothetical protein